MIDHMAYVPDGFFSLEGSQILQSEIWNALNDRSVSSLHVVVEYPISKGKIFLRYKAALAVDTLTMSTSYLIGNRGAGIG